MQRKNRTCWKTISLDKVVKHECSKNKGLSWKLNALDSVSAGCWVTDLQDSVTVARGVDEWALVVLWQVIPQSDTLVHLLLHDEFLIVQVNQTVGQLNYMIIARSAIWSQTLHLYIKINKYTNLLLWSCHLPISMIIFLCPSNYLFTMYPRHEVINS